MTREAEAKAVEVRAEEAASWAVRVATEVAEGAAAAVEAEAEAASSDHTNSRTMNTRPWSSRIRRIGTWKDRW